MQKLKSAYSRMFIQLFNILDRLFTDHLLIQMFFDPVGVIIRNTDSLYKCMMCNENLVVKEIAQSLYIIDSNIFQLCQRTVL